MKKEKKEKSFIKKPVYPGGMKAMKAFINQNLRYPEEAAKNNIQGTVTLKYTINHEGKVTRVNVISGLGNGCDEEAIRVVKLLKFQVDKVRKLRVTFKKDIHIHFRKPRKKKIKQSFQYNYTSTDSKKEDAAKENAKSKKGYSYTIQIK